MSENPVSYTEVDAKSLLRESVLVDPWFLGSFGVNLYRGCEHGCIYCDGRAERYYIEGDFARDIAVKRNALVLAERELKKRREPGFLFLGGGVSDSYQPAEATFQLARGLLKLVVASKLCVHVLTKSALVERDFDLLVDIARERRTILSFSLHSVDDTVRSRLEPNAASVSERLRLLAKARSMGMNGGIMAMPVLPGISDSAQQIDDLVQRAADAGAEFICFGGLTLRPGRQKDIYYDALRSHWPSLVPGYDRAYGRNLASGAPDRRYTEKLTARFAQALSKVRLPARIPRSLFRGMVPQYTEASVLLEHAEIEATLRGVPCVPSQSGYALAKWAHQRLVAITRRKGFSYKDVETEFLVRLTDGTLPDVAGITAEALEQLRGMGFRETQPRLGI